MRRSILLRFLGLSLAVALGAVIATAVIATYSTTEKLQGELDQNTSQLQVDGDIYSQLSTYAADNASWSGVDKLVSSLSDKTGRRIALTQPDGTVLADSARMLGAGPDLPSVPAATIDVSAQGGALPMAAVSAAVPRSMTLTKAATAGVSINGQYPGAPDWGLTPDESRQREELANQAVACLQATGRNAEAVKPPVEAPS